jgi:hypothetical protein
MPAPPQPTYTLSNFASSQPTSYPGTAQPSGTNPSTTTTAGASSQSVPQTQTVRAGTNPSNAHPSGIGPAHPPASKSRRILTATAKLLRSRIFAILIGLAALAFAIVAIVPAFQGSTYGDRSLKLAEWTAAKDFKAACQDQKVSVEKMSRACEIALATDIGPPPYVDDTYFHGLLKGARNVSARLFKRGDGQLDHQSERHDMSGLVLGLLRTLRNWMVLPFSTLGKLVIGTLFITSFAVFSRILSSTSFPRHSDPMANAIPTSNELGTHSEEEETTAIPLVIPNIDQSGADGPTKNGQRHQYDAFPFEDVFGQSRIEGTPLNATDSSATDVPEDNLEGLRRRLQGFQKRRGSDDESSWSRRGRFIRIHPTEQPPLQNLGIVGRTEISTVRKVRCQGALLVRKSVRITFRKGLRTWLRELDVLDRLDHPHLIKLVGAYLRRDVLSILLYPLADFDLATYMSLTETRSHVKTLPGFPDPRRSLKRFIRCLTSAVQYLKSNFIRQRELNPENIYVQISTSSAIPEPRIYIGDFGISLHLSSDNHTNLRGVNWKYTAIEVLHGSVHETDTSSVFTLGCIFLEMILISMDRRREISLDFLHSKNGSMPYAFFLDRIYSLLKELRLGMEFMSDLWAEERNILDTISSMLRKDPKERPKADEVLALLGGPNECCRGN